MPTKKKKFGQHFLRNFEVVRSMIDKVDLTSSSKVIEIGCGDGFLTRSILENSECELLRVYEIDEDWYEYIKKKITDKRLDLRLQDVLKINWSDLEPDGPWTMLANLPYQISFPIMFLLQKNKHIFSEGVLMLQEEVAQKIVAKKGRSCNATSLFLQHNFDFELLDKVRPDDFDPPPKVYSRLLYFKPKKSLPIKKEDDFWKFVKVCFSSPRRTIKNNLKAAMFDLESIPVEMLSKRAQQVDISEYLDLWESLNGA